MNKSAGEVDNKIGHGLEFFTTIVLTHLASNHLCIDKV